MAIVNVVGSSIAREADNVFYTLAGPEISVATTKAYSAQLIAAYVLAVQFAHVRGKIDRRAVYSAYIEELTDSSGQDEEDSGRQRTSSVVCCQTGQLPKIFSLSEEELIMQSAWKAA